MTNQFGMFIHWGIYAQTGIQEQVFARSGTLRAAGANLLPVGLRPGSMGAAGKACRHEIHLLYRKAS